MSEKQLLVLNYVAHARDHNLKANEIRSSWKWPLAIWHILCSVSYAKLAAAIGVGVYDQISVVVLILVRTPVWLGGDYKLGSKMLKKALEDHQTGAQKLPSHIQVLFLLLHRECLLRQNLEWLAAVNLRDAREIVSRANPEQATKICEILRKLHVNQKTLV